jgi:alanine racemase
MDLTVVDITDLPDSAAPVGTAVTFIGTDGGERISVEEVAGLAGTISYEILTGLTPRLPRVWAGFRDSEDPMRIERPKTQIETKGKG